MKKIIFAVLVFFAWKHFYYVESTSEVGPGALSSGIPYTTAVQERMFRNGDFSYYPRVNYEAEARVLAASRYYFDRSASISPLAILVGWEEMSDETFINQFDFSHHERSYDWDSDSMPLPADIVQTKIANLHIIPANEGVKAVLNKIRIGDLVEIKGFLVDVKNSSGWRWRSSHKNDLASNGDNNEIIYTKSLTIINPYERLY